MTLFVGNFYRLFSTALVCILLLCIPSSVSAQRNLVKTIDVSDGLPTNKVYRVSQTKDGFYWFATEQGLVRYDGQNMKVFGTEEGLPSDDVFKVYEDKIGRLWILSVTNKLVYIRNDKVVVLDTDSPTRLNVFWEDSKGVYFRNADRVIRVDHYDQFETECIDWDYAFFFNEDFNDVEPWQKQGSNSNVKSIVTEKDTFSIDEPYKHIVESTKYFSTVPSVHSTINAFNDRFMVDVVFSKDKIHVSDRLGNRVSQIEFNGKGTGQYRLLVSSALENGFLILTSNSLIRADSTLRFIDTLKISDFGIGQINSAHIDQNLNIWFATESGVKLLLGKSKSAVPFREIEGVDIAAIRKSEDILILNTSNDIYFYDLSGTKQIEKVISKDFRGIYSAVKNGDSLIVSSRNHALQIYSIKERQLLIDQLVVPFHRCPEDRLTQKSTIFTSKYFVEDEDRLVVSGGLLSFWKKDLSEYCAIGHSGNYFDIKTVPINNSIWACNRTHTFVVNSSERSFKVLDLPIEVKKIYPVDSIVVLNSFDSEIGYWSQQEEYVRVPDVKLQLVSAVQILENIYLITQRAVYKYDVLTNSIDLVFDFSSLGNSVFINDADVLDGNLCLATTNGILVFDPDLDPQSSRDRNLAITSHYSDVLYEYDYDQNNVNFTFIPIFIGDQEQLKYEYRLRPSQKSFSTTSNKEIDFVQLSPGSYEFQVRSVDQLGEKSPLKIIKFKIETPWYRTTLFYIAGLFLTFLLVGLLASLYLRRIRKKNALEQKFAELELSALQSQMNPHFIFNALNSIQNLIGRNESEKADAYVAKFAYVMRQFLEISKTKFIPLSREIDITKAYLDLEKLRFGEKLQYEILLKVSDVDMQTDVPATLIQPFVENAIVHGVFHKKGNGLVTLIIERESDTIKVTIRDDGIGLKKAGEIKSKRNRSHISRGKELINDKIEVIRKMTSYEIQIDTEDISSGTESGTEVVIRIKNVEE